MLLLFFFSFIIKTFGESCDNWNDKYICEDNEDFSFDSEWDNRGFQTPPRNDIYGRYRESYKDMHYIVGYAQLKYSLDKNTCTIKIITRVNPKLGIEGQDYYIHYIFGDIEQESDTITITSDNHNYKDGMLIMAKIMDIRRNVELVRLELEEEYFMWDNPKINQTSHYENGQKGGIVELFGWPYEDIELECEFLSHAGYLGLKIYSPNEHIIYYNNVEEEMLNPWWYITQIVSYKFNSRMGNKKQLKKMINICRSYNLRIYADIIVNHMTSDGTDMYEDHRSGDGTNCNHWSEKDSTGGSPFWTTGFRYENNTYTGLEPGLEYPAVPYFPSDFHCKSTITNWADPDELNGGWLNGLADLNTEKEYVQQRISDYYVELLSLGFSGISIANSKHILPKMHAQIFKKLKNNLGGVFPEDFFAIIQLQYGGEKQILMCESTKRINFGDFFIRKLKEEGLSDEEILKIKIWNSGYPEETPQCDGDWKITPERHALSIENPDDINLNSYYYSYIRDKNIETHRSRTMNMFNNNDIILNNLKIKSIFSMFSLINNSKGFPDGKSDCKKCRSDICRRYCTKSFPYSKAYKPLSQGYDTGDYSNWIEGTYTRVHRDLQIINSMREWMNLPTMTEDELYEGERRRADCNEECLICNDESKSKNMCLICDISKGFYPVIAPGQEQKYFECFNSAMKYERFYFNETEEAFKPCYESCKECDREGNGETHNCLKCDVDLIERPDKDSNGLYKNCVVNCSFNYNITLYGQYKCLEKAQCNANEKYYIKDKNKCIDNCENDDTYQYTYNGECLKECPVNTIKNNFLCKNKRESINYDFGEYSILVNDSECSLSQKEILLSNFQEDGEMSDIVMSYINQFHYRKRHVLQLNNSKYKIVIYRDKNCINELSINIPNIDFGECYEKALETLDNKDDIIIVYAEKTNIENPNSTYSLYDSKTGKKIYGESLCKDSWILIEKNLTVFKNQKLFNDAELLNLFVDKSIDFFNLSDPFFIDICYNFDSPKKKDIPLRERILLFYPNITL
jgi:alpha-amylase